MFTVWRNCQLFSLAAAPFPFPVEMYKSYRVSTSLPTLVIAGFSSVIIVITMHVEWYLVEALIFISQMLSIVSRANLSLAYFSLEKCLFHPSIFKLGCLSFIVDLQEFYAY